MLSILELADEVAENDGTFAGHAITYLQEELMMTKTRVALVVALAVCVAPSAMAHLPITHTPTT
jgi:hypothetical protein